jgi:hypothetical protein
MHSIRSEIDFILREEIELAQKDNPALIVRSAFEVIEDFLSQGMSMDRIASALQKHDIKVTKGHLVRHLGIVREERGLTPLKRGRKPRPSSASTLALPTLGRQSHPLAPCAQPSPAPASEPDSTPIPTGFVKNPAEQVTALAGTMDRTDRPNVEAQRASVSQSAFPDEITRLKFIDVRGEWLDITKMNIDDYLTISKTVPVNGKIPVGMFEVVAAENRIRGMYERALAQYDEALAQWKSGQ